MCKLFVLGKVFQSYTCWQMAIISYLKPYKRMQKKKSLLLALNYITISDMPENHPTYEPTIYIYIYIYIYKMLHKNISTLYLDFLSANLYLISCKLDWHYFIIPVGAFNGIMQKTISLICAISLLWCLRTNM